MEDKRVQKGGKRKKKKESIGNNDREWTLLGSSMNVEGCRWERMTYARGSMNGSCRE